MKGARRSAAAFGLLALSLLAACCLPSPVAGAASNPPPSGPSLALSLVPSELPADGGTYPALVVSLLGPGGLPSMAINATPVALVSRGAGVGTVTPLATIEPGHSFAVANFTTTSTSGTAVVSATSQGLLPASVNVTTVSPSGTATGLQVIPVPASYPVGAAGAGTLLVEAVDQAGLPAELSSDVVVSLSSSDPAAVGIPFASLTLGAGSFLGSTYYQAGLSPGAASIEASAPGLDSATGTVNVVGGAATALKIFAQPDPMPTSAAGRLVVALVDAQGDPVRAPADMTVALSSSNTSLISTGGSVSIQAGQLFATVPLSSGPFPGTTDVAASSPGLASSFAGVQVAAPSLPASLDLAVAPDAMPADNGSFDSVLVSLADSSGGTAVAASSVTVALSSSNSTVGNVSGTVTIPAGASFAVAAFTSTYVPGTTTLTALAQNLKPATASATTSGASPSRLVLKQLFPDLPSDGRSYQAIEVELEGAAGAPALAPAATSVRLYSSSPGVVSVASLVTIPAGQSFATVTASSGSSGTSVVNATALGLAATAQVSTASLAASRVGIFVAPASGVTGPSGPEAVLAVQLQGQDGRPAIAAADTLVSVSSSNQSVVEGLQLDIPAGSGGAWVLLNSTAAGASTLTASAGGLPGSSANLTLSPFPVTVTLTGSPAFVSEGGDVVLTLHVEALGTPVAGAKVEISTTAGTLGVPGGVTDANGVFTDTFSSSQPGVAMVTATVSSPLLGTQTASTGIPVSQKGTGGSGLLGLVLPLVVVVAVVAAIALLVRRSLKRRGLETDGAQPDEGRPPDGA